MNILDIFYTSHNACELAQRYALFVNKNICFTPFFVLCFKMHIRSRFIYVYLILARPFHVRDNTVIIRV